MDRQTKLAYRQRGSRLRHFSSSSNGKNDDNDGSNEVSTDGTLVIKTPLRLNPGINSVTDFDVEPLAEEQPELKRQHVETEIETVNQGEPGPELTEEEEEEYTVDGEDVTAHLLSWDYYKELQLDKSQLNSITVIRDLIDNLTNKFLLPKAKEQTSPGEIVSSNNNNKDTNSLDTKVFELFNEGVSTDLKDIRDINEANNIILKQIDKKLRRVKTLNAELAYVKARYADIVQNYTRAGDKQGQRSNNRLELDEQLLSKLTRRILLSPSRSGLQRDNGLYAECDSSVEQLCELLNPTDGLVARLRDLQIILRSSEFLCHEEER